jgi:hypothetical protein
VLHQQRTTYSLCLRANGTCFSPDPYVDTHSQSFDDRHCNAETKHLLLHSVRVYKIKTRKRKMFADENKNNSPTRHCTTFNLAHQDRFFFLFNYDPKLHFHPVISLLVRAFYSLVGLLLKRGRDVMSGIDLRAGQYLDHEYKLQLGYCTKSTNKSASDSTLRPRNCLCLSYKICSLGTSDRHGSPDRSSPLLPDQVYKLVSFPL